MQLGVLDVIRRLSGNPDPTLQKYLQRIQTKLTQGGVTGLTPPAGARA